MQPEQKRLKADTMKKTKEDGIIRGAVGSSPRILEMFAAGGCVAFAFPPSEANDSAPFAFCIFLISVFLSVTLSALKEAL